MYLDRGVSYRTWIAVCGRISPSQFQLLWEGIQPQALCSLQIWLRNRLPPAPLSLRSTSESHSWYLGVNRNCLTRYTSTKEWSNCTKKEIRTRVMLTEFHVKYERENTTFVQQRNIYLSNKCWSFKLSNQRILKKISTVSTKCYCFNCIFNQTKASLSERDFLIVHLQMKMSRIVPLMRNKLMYCEFLQSL